MSQVAKKIKLDAVSMDPFDEEILPFDVHEYILQYLNGSDLLKASEVSLRWNQKVEGAKGFLEKIKLTIASIPPPEGNATQSKTYTSNNMLTRDDLAAVLNSQRNYVNVDIRFGLLDWVQLCKDLLQKFSASIKYMACDFFIYIYKETQDVTFPNLTQLEIIEPRYQNRSCEILLPLMPAVETLRVDTITDGQLWLISCQSKSLKEVRCKRKRHVSQWNWTPDDFINPSLNPINHNIRIIQE